MTVRPTHPPTRVMRENPDMDQLRRQARELLEAYRAQAPDAVLEVEAYHRTATPDTFRRPRLRSFTPTRSDAPNSDGRDAQVAAAH